MIITFKRDKDILSSFSKLDDVAQLDTIYHHGYICKVSVCDESFSDDTDEESYVIKRNLIDN